MAVMKTFRGTCHIIDTPQEMQLKLKFAYSWGLEL